ncbi:MAG: hypothetical protein M3R04_00945 [bacterium]|nr:hypothetical protein [bacterium]
MAMFGNFDFGKGLKKQAEAFSRAPVASRGRKHPQLLKQLDTYASKLLYTVITHSAQVNPGQLRTGAEALVEISVMLGEPAPAYRVFADLAVRSRKVPAVPQFAQLVDKLLELPTGMKKERSALLTYRIVTGTLSSERYLAYLRERAHLTDESTDWKDYALGVARLIRDGVVQSNDDMIGETLQDLVNNKKSLGDQATSIQQMLAESMLQRRNSRQAEFILVEAAVSGGELSDSFHKTVEAVLNSRPECCWELHQLVLQRALVQFDAGEIDWPNLLQRLMRAKQHEEPLLTFLVEHPLIGSDSRLGTFVRQGLQNLPDERRMQLIDRFVQLVDGHTAKAAELAPPSSAIVEQQAPLPDAVAPPPLAGRRKQERTRSDPVPFVNPRQPV